MLKYVNKKNSLIFFAIFLPLLFGCTDILPREREVQGDSNAKCLLKVWVNPSVEKTVLRQEAYEEFSDRVENCYLIAFNALTGEKIASFNYLRSRDGGPNFNGISNAWNNTITHNKASRLMIYAIANYGGMQSYYKGGPTDYDLQRVRTIDDLKNLPAFSNPTPSNGDREKTYFLMTGTTEYRINSGVSGAVTINVELHRVDAEINFSISLNSSSKDDRFYPLSWRVCNVPLKIFPYKVGSYDTERAENKQNYNPASNSDWHPFEESSLSTSLVKNGVIFYVPQNRLKAQKTIDASLYNSVTGESLSSLTDVQKFRMRSHRAKTVVDATDVPQNVSNGDFDVAPTCATYIEVQGKYKSYNKDGTYRIADVQYTIPLGYCGYSDAQTSIDKADDYCVDANTKYTIHAYVKSVDNIVAEVTKNNMSPANHDEYDTNAEGYVIDTKNYVQLDAHYGTFILRVKRKDLFRDDDRTKRNHVDFDVSTPFDSPYPAALGGITSDKAGKRDLKWLKFVRITSMVDPYLNMYYFRPRTELSAPNSKTGYAYAYILPGGYEKVENLNSHGVTFLTMERQALSPGALRYDSGCVPTAPYNNGYFYINDLVLFLNTIDYDSPLWQRGQKSDLSGFDDDPQLLFGGLVSEFLYDKDQRKDLNGQNLSTWYNGSDQEWEENSWKLVVNQPDRIMNLYFNKKKRSSDHNSYHSVPDFSVYQHSVKTVNKGFAYRGEKYSNKNGKIELNGDYPLFGFETIDERYANEGSTDTQNDHSYFFYHGSQENSNGLNRNPYASGEWGGSQSHKADIYRKNIFLGYRASLAIWGFIDKTDLESQSFDPRSAWTDWRVQRSIWKDHYRSVISSLQDKSIIGGLEREALNATSSVVNECLSRNHDLNGDGYIQLNEVRWYIPSFGQLMFMKLANETLPFDERLMSQRSQGSIPSGGIDKFLVTTAAGFGKAARYLMFTGSPEFVSYFLQNDNFNNSPNWPLAMRCVRTLGKTPVSIDDYDDKDKNDVVLLQPQASSIPRTLYYANKNEPKYWSAGESSYWLVNRLSPETRIADLGLYIDLRRIAPAFLRRNYVQDQELPKAPGPFLASLYDKPYYKGFRVATRPCESRNGFHALTARGPYQEPRDKWYYRQTSDASNIGGSGDYWNCGSYDEKWTIRDRNGIEHTGYVRGWRMPSMLELAFMITYIPWINESNSNCGWSNSGYQESTMMTFGCATLDVYSLYPCFIIKDYGVKNYINMSRTPSTTPFAVRCVRDWDPDHPTGITFDDGYVPTKDEMGYYMNQ